MIAREAGAAESLTTRYALFLLLLRWQDEGMVDVRSRRCQEPSCTRQPSFGFEHQKPRFVSFRSAARRVCVSLEFSCETKATTLYRPSPAKLLISSFTICCVVGRGSVKATAACHHRFLVSVPRRRWEQKRAPTCLSWHTAVQSWEAQKKNKHGGHVVSILSAVFLLIPGRVRVCLAIFRFRPEF